MHLTEGVNPENVDINVRFRTTYYFRTFDYCWNVNQAVGTGGPLYRTVIPGTDTLYRFRMTGKASALGSRIRFESGTLNAADIDPFGANVVHDQETGGFVFLSQAETQRRALAADERADTLARIRELTAQIGTIEADSTLSPASRADAITQLRAATAGLVQRYTGTEVALPTALRSELNALQANVARLQAALSGGPAPQAATATPGNAPQLCPAGVQLRKGFQIMGPEGMRPFNQDERLIMAMHTSAKPLIETLQEYSGRMLQGEVNRAEHALPLAREQIVTLEAERAIDPSAAPTPAGLEAWVGTMFDAVLTAFDPTGGAERDR